MFNLFRRVYHSKRDAEIEIFFRHVNWYKLLRAWGLFPTFSAARDTIDVLIREEKNIKKRWHGNSQSTLAQILALMNLLPIRKIAKGNNTATWYFDDIADLMEIMGIPEREHILWTSNYNMFGIKRKYPKVVLIKDMSSNHIKRILKGQKFNMTHHYTEIFRNELARRKL